MCEEEMLNRFCLVHTETGFCFVSVFQNYVDCLTVLRKVEFTF